MFSSAVTPDASGALPLLGNLHQIARRGFIHFLRDQTALHGDTFHLWLGRRRVLVTSKPEALERIFVTNRANYVKHDSYDVVRELLGDSLVTTEGEVWRRRRRLAQPTFQRRHLGHLGQTMVEVISDHLDALRHRLPDGGVFDAQREMTRMTLHVAMETLFGRGLFADSDIDYGMLKDSLELMSDRNGALGLPLWIPTPGNRRFRRMRQQMYALVDHVIAAARHDPDRIAGTLLSTLIAARDEESGSTLADQELRDEVITLIVAGHDTTTLTLTWWLALARPDVQQRMVDEIEGVLAGAPPSVESARDLVYVRRVIDEVLRLRPPAHLVPRDALAGDDLAGHAVDAGDLVFAHIYLAHHHPDHWDDPDRFDPDRFTDEAKSNRPIGAYCPFIHGQRVCIGQHFALLEATVALALMLQRAQFTAIDDGPLGLSDRGTLRPDRPVRIRVDWR